jgi:AcrR family transcriptional regulator
MPRSPLAFRQMREESRDRLIAAALELFARHGYGATSVRMIAERAGVAQGLLYNYFAGKDALLRAIFERSMADVWDSFSVAAAGAAPADRLERLVRAALEIVGRHRSFWRLSYQVRMQPEVLASLGEEVLGWAAAIRARLATLLQEAGSTRPEIEARVLFAAIDGAAQHFVLDPEGYPVDEVCREIVARFPGARGADHRRTP